MLTCCRPEELLAAERKDGASGRDSLPAASVADCKALLGSGREGGLGRAVSNPDPVAFDLRASTAAAAAAEQPNMSQLNCPPLVL